MSRLPRAVWLLTGAALLVRALPLAFFPDLPCVNDECFYSQLARTFAAGDGFAPHAQHYWPPGYIAFLGLALRAGIGFAGAKAIQVVLATALIPLTAALGMEAARGWGEAGARRVGVTAAAILAFDPTLIAFSHYLWPETLFLPLFTGGLLLVLRATEGPRPALALGAGLLLGAACLVKVFPLYFTPALAAWVIFGAGSTRAVESRREALPVSGAPRRWMAAGMLLAGVILVVLPWTARNYAVHGRLVIVDTTNGKNLVRGNHPLGPTTWDWGVTRGTHEVIESAPCPQKDPVDYNRCMTAYGRRLILEDPGRFVSRIGTKLADLLNPTSFVVRHLRRGLYGATPLLVQDGIVAVVAAFNIVLMAAALLGWILAPAGRARSLVALIILYMVAVHAVTFGLSRFRLPAEPWLAVGAALLLAAPVAARQSLHSGGRRWIALALLALLATGWAARAGTIFSREEIPAETRDGSPANGRASGTVPQRGSPSPSPVAERR